MFDIHEQVVKMLWEFHESEALKEDPRKDMHNPSNEHLQSPALFCVYRTP